MKRSFNCSLFLFKEGPMSSLALKLCDHECHVHSRNLPYIFGDCCSACPYCGARIKHGHMRPHLEDCPEVTAAEKRRHIAHY